MFEGLLSDLDELALSVRSKNSREYISEAIADYRARAFRSSISAVWVAVTYDIISKIRELALQGDAAAKKYTADLDKAIALGANDAATSKKLLQAIENKILDVAKIDYEFLSQSEFREMVRLREDRNLCAHPAFVGEDILFQPTPDLVRTHIVNAITALLQHPPIQGKTALNKLKSDLLQPSFPTTQTAVSKFMDAAYLTHVRAALLDNIVTVFLKALIKQTDPQLVGREETVMMCLVAVQRRHGLRTDARIKNDLPRLTDGASEDELKRTIRLFRFDRRCWTWLEIPIRLRITEIASQYSYSKNDIDGVIGCLEVDELRPLFAARIAGLSPADKREVYTRHPNQIFADDAIRLYGDSSTYRSAEHNFETLIRPFIGTYNSEHIRQVVAAAANNGQIWDALQTPSQLTDLLVLTQDLAESTKDAWSAFDAQMTTTVARAAKYQSLHQKLEELRLL